MPILTDNENTPSPIIPSVPAAIPPPYYSNVVDSRYINFQNLLVHIEGSSWIVNYYSQVLGNDDELSSQQPNLPSIYQQYKKIKNFELKVTAPLTQSQNSGSNEFVVRGTSTIYPFLIPNLGDIFIADIGNGRDGLFSVTKSEKKSIYTESCYEIEYSLIAYADDSNYVGDLESKVVETLVFSKDYLENGHNPLFIEEKYASILQIKDLYKKTLKRYISETFSINVQSLIIPNQPTVTTDTFLTKCLLKVLDSKEHLFIPKIRNFNTDGDRAMHINTLWDCLLQVSDDLLPLVAHKMGLTSSSNFYMIPQFESIFYAGVQSVVYPLVPRLDVDAKYSQQTGVINGHIIRGSARVIDVRRLSNQSPLDANYLEPHPNEVGIDSLPDIHLVTKDSYYVFSESFYFDTEGQSKLERLVLDTLQTKKVDPLLLNYLLKTCKQWDYLEQFYYIPVLLILSKILLRNEL